MIRFDEQKEREEFLIMYKALLREEWEVEMGKPREI